MWSEHCSYKSLEGAPAPVRRPAARATRCSSASARTPAWSTSATATRSPSRSSRTTTRATSSRTRARRPASAASSATSSPWAPARSRSWTRLRFGRADAPDTARVLPGVVAGVGGYGNCLGLPNIGGELLFDDCYAGNPLVNALCVGVMKHEDVRLAKAEGLGNKVILFGARTGGDGIGGVSVLAQRDLRRRGPGQAPERAGRRPVHREAADRGVPGDLRRRTSSPASRTSAAPASPAPRPSWPAPAPAACTSTSTPSRCATARSRRPRS